MSLLWEKELCNWSQKLNTQSSTKAEFITTKHCLIHCMIKGFCWGPRSQIQTDDLACVMTMWVPFHSKRMEEKVQANNENTPTLDIFFSLRVASTTEIWKLDIVQLMKWFPTAHQSHCKVPCFRIFARIFWICKHPTREIQQFNSSHIWCEGKQILKSPMSQTQKAHSVATSFRPQMKPHQTKMWWFCHF